VRGKERTNRLPLSLSLSRRACNPYYELHPWCRIIQGLPHLLCSIPRQPIWAGARSDNLTRRSRDPPRSETPTEHVPDLVSFFARSLNHVFSRMVCRLRLLLLL
jgi:hypothetical protein